MGNLFLPLALLFFISIGAQGQNVVMDFENPSRVTICNSAIFTISVTNTGTNQVQDIEITAELPGMLTYEAGSVTGGTEEDVSDPEKPVFGIAGLAGGQTVNLQFSVFASCDVFDSSQSGTLFTNNYSASFPGGNTSVTTDPYPVETPFLVITNVTNKILRGSRGDRLRRIFTIKNTRLGALSEFTFTDVHGGGFTPSSPNGTDVNPDYFTFQIVLDGNDFRGVGDRDVLLEFNETINVVEDLDITACGSDTTFSLSRITIGWGCDGETCQSNSTNVALEIGLNERTPDLSFETMPAVPNDCFCSDGGAATQQMIITNDGHDIASNIAITIRQDSNFNIYRTSIDPASFSIDSAGTMIPVTDITTLLPQNYMPDCELGLPLFRSVVIRIPQLAPGESITLTWDTYTCKFTCTQIPNNFYYVNASYETVCPPPANRLITEEFGVTINEDFSASALDLLNQEENDGTVHSELEYWLRSHFLQNTSGILNLEISFPSYLGPLNPSWILGGLSPISIEENQTGGNTTFDLTFQLPFPGDSVSMLFELEHFCDSLADVLPPCIVITETGCTDPCIPPSQPMPSLPISITAIFDINPDCPEDCQPSSCASLAMDPGCPIDSTCFDTIPGFVDFTVEAYRKNLGLTDNDNNRQADAGGMMNLNLVRRDRFIPGDTLQGIMRGIVVTNTDGENFRYGNATFQYNGIGPLNVLEPNQTFFTQPGISQVRGAVRIFDESTGTYYTSSDIQATVTGLPGTIAFNYSLNPDYLRSRGANMPSGFVYERGDSIIVEFEHRIIKNFLPVTQTPPKVDFAIFGTLSVYNEQDAADAFHCRCFRDEIQISGYEFKISPALYALSPCDISAFDAGTLMELELAEGNFFPYEVRPLGVWNELRLGFRQDVIMTEARLSSLALQGASNLYENVALTFTRQDSLYIFDLTSFHNNPLLDEGFYLQIQNKFDGPCDLTGSSPVQFIANLDFLHQFPGQDDPVEISLRNNAIRSLISNLSITTPFPYYESNDRFGRWSLNLKNSPTSVGSPMSGATPNTWIYPESLTGNVTDFQLYDVTTGEYVPIVNGIFQLGSYPGNALQEFILTGNNMSCSEEVVTVHYGWNCDPYENPDEVPCYRRSIELLLLSFSAEVETILDTLPLTGDLCDTLPYFNIEIINAELGTLYDPYLEVTLPPGLEVLPGSSQASHPAGTGYVTIGDPDLLPGNIARWNLQELIDSIGIRGLPGVTRDSFNIVRLRFRTLTDCNFIAESYPVFRVRGMQNCGDPTNSRTRAAKPVSINGAPPPYRTSISVNAPSSAGCGDAITFSFSLTPDDITGVQDSIFLTLPAGLQFVPGSYQPGTNAPPEAPQVFQNGPQQLLKWKMPENILAGQTIEMSVEISGFEQLECEQQFILLQAVTTANALCVATNELCSILVQTGSLFLPINVERPDFEISDLNLSILVNENGEEVNFLMTVNNSGAPASPPVVIDFYLDNDGDGNLSASDVLVHSENLNTSLATGASALLSGRFHLQAGDACNLLIVIDPAKNCICDPEIFPWTLPIERNFEEVINACSDEEITIGVPSAGGHSYNWQPADHLSCATCPETVFRYKNTSPIERTFQYTLIDNNQDGCRIRNNFMVSVQPEPQILTPSQSLCSGECIILQTTEASSVQWDGPDISNPGEAIQNVCPDANARYTVLITDPEGCQGRDTLDITVFSSPMVNAGRDTLMCVGEVLQLQATGTPGIQFRWSPANLVNNPGIANPILTITQPSVLQVTGTDANGCDDTDAVFVDIREETDLNVSPDVITCESAVVVLSASGAADYLWSPDETLNCNDCPQVEAMPLTTTTYTVIGSFGGACPDTASVTIAIAEDTIFTFETLAICEGETVEIFGEEVSEAGDYQQHFTTAFDCDSLHTITLTVNPLPEFALETIHPVCPDSCTGSIEIFSPGILLYRLNGGAFTDETFYEGLCPGDFTIEAQDANNCTSNIQSLTLEEPAAANVTVSQDTTINAGDTVQLSVVIPDGVTVVSLQWNPSESLSCSTCENPLAFPTDSTTYTVEIVTSEGCIINREVAVHVNLVCALDMVKIPNVFSPNGDGTNDTFAPILELNSAEIISLEIWNRWGERVYKGAGRDAAWDGMQNGELAPSDTYVYIIKLGCVDSSDKKVGDVMVLR